jgi:hypothetical protein
MKRTALFCSLLLALVIVALAAVPDSQKAKTVPRDISGVMDGRFTFTGPDEGPWTTTGDVTGTLRHLGLAKMYTTHTASPDGTISRGIFSIVAANGDEILGSYTASGILSDDYTHVDGTANFLITGGSGRFVHATGTITAAFIETLDDPTFAGAAVSWALLGTVSY